MKKPSIIYQDFQKLDIRVGEIISAEKVEGSKKMLRLRVDLGEDYGQVTILTGLAELYSPARLAKKKYLFVANLEPRKMMGEMSQGMLLVTGSGKSYKVFTVRKSVPNGAVIL